MSHALANIGLRWWHSVFFVLLFIVSILALNTLIPWNGVDIQDYEVVRDEVCAGGTVAVYAQWRYEETVRTVNVQESWVTVSVPGMPRNRSVSSHVGTVDRDWTAGDTFTRERSTLITSAPEIPGTYRLEGRSVTRGSRFGSGLLPVVDEDTFRTADIIRVRSCAGGGKE